MTLMTLMTLLKTCGKPCAKTVDNMWKARGKCGLKIEADENRIIHINSHKFISFPQDFSTNFHPFSKNFFTPFSLST